MEKWKKEKLSGTWDEKMKDNRDKEKPLSLKFEGATCSCLCCSYASWIFLVMFARK